MWHCARARVCIGMLYSSEFEYQSPPPSYSCLDVEASVHAPSNAAAAAAAAAAATEEDDDADEYSVSVIASNPPSYRSHVSRTSFCVETTSVSPPPNYVADQSY